MTMQMYEYNYYFTTIQVIIFFAPVFFRKQQQISYHGPYHVLT